jgi:hypothetical protein
MTFIVKATTATGNIVSVIVAANGRNIANKLATPILYQEIDSRIVKREIVKLS